jgi:hypothetical protein
MGTTSFRIEFGKFRAKAEEALMPQVMTLGDFGWIIGEDESDNATQLIKAIRSGRFETQQDAAFSIGIKDKGTASKKVKAAVNAGLITRDELKAIFHAAKEARLEEQGRRMDEAARGETDGDDYGL